MDLLANVTYELIPFRTTFDKAMAIPAGARVSVTASPVHGMTATVELSCRLQAAGYQAVPHLGARYIQTRAELTEVVARLAEAGVSRAFVIGGDAPDYGLYPDALSLLADLVEMGHPFTELGVAGYPEGHPLIPDDVLEEALLAKAPLVTYLVTQMCFEVEAIGRWVSQVREHGIGLPVVVGVPGVIDPIKLATISARIGVGASIRYLSKNRKAIGRLLRPGSFSPERLVSRIGELEPPVAGLHIFTFNQIEPTVEWLGAGLGVG